MIPCAARPYWRLNDPLCSERVTMHCQRGRKPAKTAHSPLDFATQLQEDTATAIGNIQRKIDKDRACDSGDILQGGQTDRQTDRQTDTRTYVLITILRHSSRGQSKKTQCKEIQSFNPVRCI